MLYSLSLLPTSRACSGTLPLALLSTYLDWLERLTRLSSEAE